MGNEDFMKDYLWIIVMVGLLFVAFVGYTVNQDPEEEEEDNLNNDEHED
jgi:hypothetical protein